MAETELKIKVTTEGTEEVETSLNNLGDSIEETGDKSEQAKDKTKSLFDTFKDAGANIAGWISTFQEIAGTVSAASAEYQRQSGIINNLAGSIDEASTRMNGLVSNIDLMESRNRLAATGLALTSQEFANISVAAQQFAQSTGRDVQQTMEQLNEAISEGSVEALQKFGIELSDTSSKSAIQESALASLEEIYGDVEVSATGASQGITSVGNSIDNAVTAMIEGSRTGGNFQRTMDELDSSIRHLATSFGIEFTEGISTAEEAGRTFSAGLNVMVRTMSTLIESVNDFGNANFDQALARLRSIGDIARQVGLEAAGQQAQDVINRALTNVQNEIRAVNTEGSSVQAPTAPRGSGGGQQEREWEPAEALRRANEQVQQMQRLMNQVIQDNSAIAAIQRQISDELNLGEAADTRKIANLRLQIELLGQTLEQTEALKNAANFAYAERERQFQIDQRNLADSNAARRRDGEEQERQRQLTIDQQKQQNRLNLGLNTANDLMGMGANILQVSHKQGKQAAKEQLKEWLKSFAMQEALKGGSSLAEAIGMTVTNTAGAVTKYSEAGYHFALAAAAGGSSAAIKGGGGGQPATPGNANAGPVKPSSGTSTSGGSTQPSNITINIEGQALLTQGQIGREIQNALSAYQRGY